MANDGGPAFPGKWTGLYPEVPDFDGDGVQTEMEMSSSGMSFRDVAAIAAMQGQLENGEGGEHFGKLAAWSYDIAQALTDERQRRLEDEQAG